MTETQPDASGQIDIAAPAERVYDLISDPGALAECASEYSGYRWLGGAQRAEVGARFMGRNKKSWARWVTVARITDADRGKRFGFDVTAGPLRAAHWRYEIEPAGDGGCRVTESTWDYRPRKLRPFLDRLLGIQDRATHNKTNIHYTLHNIKSKVEPS
ncbi:SRPBCC family protein [Haloechinothrix sp. LS1_15]|uniref:SRPBCC family protein n=1 Tax=Haloechinothrix sp. LS1_15 TaxID=2652248 RepID=UPI002946A18D|nr:SRPBCC family protein [Haloechinothrix sp. LS1_15]MDV6011071.1 SRPBCC family protein [Haloechinothrix sp. LS1_15]